MCQHGHIFILNNNLKSSIHMNNEHGLNIHSLTNIFQYLDSADLYTVGGMNDFYKNIIIDLLMVEHAVNFIRLYV